MTPAQLVELDGIPQWFGEPLYPQGLPLQRESITWTDDETLEDKWRKRLEAVVSSTTPDQEDERLLKNWVVYYLHAPIWQTNPYGTGPIDELLAKDLLALPLNKLIWECIDIGLDPF